MHLLSLFQRYFACKTMLYEPVQEERPSTRARTSMKKNGGSALSVRMREVLATNIEMYEH